MTLEFMTNAVIIDAIRLACVIICAAIMYFAVKAYSSGKSLVGHAMLWCVFAFAFLFVSTASQPKLSIDVGYESRVTKDESDVVKPAPRYDHNDGFSPLVSD